MPCLHCTRRKLICSYEEEQTRPRSIKSKRKEEEESEAQTAAASTSHVRLNAAEVRKKPKEEEEEQQKKSSDAIIEGLRTRIKHLELRLAQSTARQHQKHPVLPSGHPSASSGEDEVDQRLAAGEDYNKGIKISYPGRNLAHPAYDSRAFAASASASLAATNEDTLAQEPEKVAKRPDPILDLLWPNWPAELPEPAVVVAMCDLCESLRMQKGVVSASVPFVLTLIL